MSHTVSVSLPKVDAHPIECTYIPSTSQVTVMTNANQVADSFMTTDWTTGDVDIGWDGVLDGVHTISWLVTMPDGQYTEQSFTVSYVDISALDCATATFDSSIVTTYSLIEQFRDFQTMQIPDTPTDIELLA